MNRSPAGLARLVMTGVMMPVVRFSTPTKPPTPESDGAETYAVPGLNVPVTASRALLALSVM